MSTKEKKILLAAIILFAIFQIAFTIISIIYYFNHFTDYFLLFIPVFNLMIILTSLIYYIRFILGKIANKKGFFIISGIVYIIIIYGSLFNFATSLLDNLLIFGAIDVLLNLFLIVYSFIMSTKYKSPKKEKLLKDRETKLAFENLKNLKSLFDNGIITEQEYEEKKKSYISHI